MNVELGKLEVNSIDSDDNGDYECALPNGKKYKYRISVIDLPSISLFETRTNLKKSGVFYVNEPNEIVEQVCTSATTSSYLNIEWYDHNGRVRENFILIKRKKAFKY